MKINFVYHTPTCVNAGYMGSQGLRVALEQEGLLDYAFNQTKDVLDIEALQRSPVFFVRGFLRGRMPYVARAGNQFRAAWQSESFFTRHGDKDSSTEMALENQNNFNMMFVCSESDLGYYDIPTYLLPSWADTNVFYERCKPDWDGLGFFGGVKGREDFLNGDKKGIIRHERTKSHRESKGMADDLSWLISRFHMLVAPPGRCFNGMCGRAFEIMACRRLCFQYLNEDTMFEHMKFFDDGRDIVYWHDWDELNDKYEYYRKRPIESDQIANRGYEKVTKYHNERVRARYIVECMKMEYERYLRDQESIPDIINEVYASL